LSSEPTSARKFAKVSRMSEDAGEYAFYPCVVDGAPASIYLDMRYEHVAPPAGAHTRYSIAVRMRDAGPPGVGTAEEAEALNTAEEALIARAAGLGLVYVGRLRNRGEWDVTFYGPPGREVRLRDAAGTYVDDREVIVHVHDDPQWRYYFELLLPDAERRQWIDDRRVVQVLKEHGDVLGAPRRVDHFASFGSAGARDAFVQAAATAGFALADASHDEPAERPFDAHVYRDDPVELDHIHDVVMILVDAAAEHRGSYDGWEAGIVGN
jgi:hypothetical protein